MPNDERKAIQEAIEDPRNVSNPQQPRQPRNLQDVLRYATEAGQGASTSRGTPMDNESRRFLGDYLNSMIGDTISDLKSSAQAIEQLAISEDFNKHECDKAFDTLLDLVDKVDFANDFHKIGGFKIFDPCFTSAYSDLRWRACDLIAELCQNNIYCQSKCAEEGYVPKLMTLINSDPDELVRVKAFYALSCLVRDNEPALKEFTEKDGFSLILRALQSDTDKLKIKSSFLISSLCSTTPNIIDDLIEMGFIEQMIGLIVQNESQLNKVELFLRALSSIVGNSEKAQEICQQPNLNLAYILEDIIENAKEKDEAKEVVEYASSIQETVFSGTDRDFVEDR